MGARLSCFNQDDSPGSVESISTDPVIQSKAFVTLMHDGRHVPFELTSPPASESVLIEQLSVALACPKEKTIAGFIVDDKLGGPLCPTSLFSGIDTSSSERSSVTPILLPIDELRTFLGPLSPAPTRDVLWTDIVQAVKELSTYRSHALSHDLASQLLREGYVRLDMGAPAAAVAERAYHAAHSFFALPRSDKSRQRVQSPEGKFAGYAYNGAREFFQVRWL